MNLNGRVNLTKLAEKKENSMCKHEKTCTENVFIGFLRSFIVSYGIKYGINLIPALLTGKLFKKPSLFYKLGGKDTISFALFLSTFISIYKGVLCGLRRLRNTNDALNSLIAGGLAGMSLMLDTNNSRRRMIALYLSTRTCHFISRGVWRYFIGKIIIIILEIPSQNVQEISKKVEQNSQITVKNLEEKRKWHQEVRGLVRQFSAGILMMLSSGQIIYSFCCEPETLSKSYHSFLLTHSGLREVYGHSKAKDAMKVITSCLNANAGSTKYLADSPDLKYSLDPSLPVAELSALNFERSPGHEFALCSVQHPHRNYCLYSFRDCIISEFQRGIFLYAPLNFLMSVLFKGKKFLEDPAGASTRIIFTTLRSAIFLTAYVSCAWSSSCAFRRLFGIDKPARYFLSGFLAGSAVFIESRGRRLELALYCLPRAIEAAWNCAVKWGYWNHLWGGEALYFSLASSILMSLYQHDPESIHDGYRKVMVRLIGVN